MAAGFRFLNVDIKAQIDAVGDAEFVFGAVRKYDPGWHTATVERLALVDVENDTHQGLPPARVGRWSGWNTNGWVKVWRDRPKTFQTFTHQVPDYNGTGWHDISQTREVWQKTRWFGEQVEATLTYDEDASYVSTGIVGKILRGPFDEANEHVFRYAASLSREWFGDARVFKIGDEGVPEVPTDSLTWDPLPPGTLD